MKIFSTLLILTTIVFGSELQPKNLDEYLKNFDLQERKNMKINSSEMVLLVQKKEAVLLDIRFNGEYESWNMPFAKHIPLNELPNRLNELPKDKLIITACPHNDRANIARIYLITKGYNAKYLDDGLLKTADLLRGSTAVEFIDNLKSQK